MLALSSRMRGLSLAGDHSGLLYLFVQMSREQAAKPNRPVYLLLLKSSTALSSYRLGLSLHGHILKSGYQKDVFVATALVDMLAKCSDVDGARAMFGQMLDRDVAAWNAMISGYARKGYADEALDLFSQMSCRGLKPNSLTLSVLLQVCGGCEDRRLGRSIHAYAVKHLELIDTFLGNSFLVYYSKACEFHISERIFDRMLERDIVSWNAMITGYTQGGISWRSLEEFRLLREGGFHPDLVTIESVLQACAQIGENALSNGRLVHALSIKSGYAMDVYAENSLLLMYCKCGMMEFGQSLFDRMEARNVVSWNILINGYVQNKRPEKALTLIKHMCFAETEISSDLLVNALKAIKLTEGCLKYVMCLHCFGVVMGLGSDAFLNSSLIAAYGDCGELDLARRSLDYAVSERSNSTICWNSMLSLYARHGCFSEALELLGCMQANACILDAATLVSTLSMCTLSMDLKLGEVVHGYIIKNNFESDVFVTTSLIEFYARCGLLSVACWLFSKMPCRSIVTWNTMIHGCLQNGFPAVSLKLFHLMREQDGFMPDATSLVGAVDAVSYRGCVQEGSYIYKYAVEAGLVDDEYVANSLIAMHARFHDFDKAIEVFLKAKKVKTVTWNNMIAEYSYHDLANQAISVFHLMKVNNVAPDSITLLSLLHTCAVLGSLSCTMWLHSFTYKVGYLSDVFVGTSLVDVYAKCGYLHKARQLFDEMNSKTAVSWNTMIQAYGMNGNIEESGKLFCLMQHTGLNPTVVTFLILISACSHAGEVERGQHYLDMMTHVYSFSPGKKHFSALVDLLARKGLVKETFEALKKMPMDPGVDTWGALLGACRVEGNLEVGLSAAKKLFELDPLHSGYYVLLSNMCADAGRWMDASAIRTKLEKMGLKKVQGWSTVEGFS